MLGYCKSCGAVNRFDGTTALSKKPVCGKCQSEIELHDLVQDLDTNGLQKILRNSKIPVIVDFWAEWCGPCKMYGPVFQAVSKEFANKVQFIKINTEREQQIAAELGIRGIPASVLFVDGKVKDSISGALNYDQLGQWLRSKI
jgi:thioredoxin 2